MTEAHLRNPHDGGWDIYTGRDVASGERLGVVFWDASVPTQKGLVLRWWAEDEEFPDDADDALAMIAARGYELDESSVEDLRALVPR